MINKWRKMLSILLIIGVGSGLLIPNTVYGKSVSSGSVSDQIQIEVPDSSIGIAALKGDQGKLQLQKHLSKLTQQLQQMKPAIRENHQIIIKMAKNIEETNTDITELKSEITTLEKRIQKRNQVLKKRAQSFQESGGNMSYLQVLVGSANLRDFVERADTVTQIVQADHEILKQQTAEKAKCKTDRISLEKKLKELTETKTEYEVMNAQAAEQQRQVNQFKKMLKTKQHGPLQKHSSNSIVVQKEDNSANSKAAPVLSGSTPGFLTKILSSSSKYIGNSVYVFGGGRTANDIANGRFDCSGFVHWAFAQVGIDVGSNTDSIKNSGRQVPETELQPGDLVFFDTYKQDGHVGIYIGKGKFIGSQSSTGVAIADMTQGYWKEAFHGRVVRI